MEGDANEPVRRRRREDFAIGYIQSIADIPRDTPVVGVDDPRNLNRPAVLVFDDGERDKMRRRMATPDLDLVGIDDERAFHGPVLMVVNEQERRMFRAWKSRELTRQWYHGVWGKSLVAAVSFAALISAAASVLSLAARH